MQQLEVRDWAEVLNGQGAKLLEASEYHQELFKLLAQNVYECNN